MASCKAPLPERENPIDPIEAAATAEKFRIDGIRIECDNIRSERERINFLLHQHTKLNDDFLAVFYRDIFMEIDLKKNGMAVVYSAPRTSENCYLAIENYKNIIKGFSDHLGPGKLLSDELNLMNIKSARFRLGKNIPFNQWPTTVIGMPEKKVHSSEQKKPELIENGDEFKIEKIDEENEYIPADIHKIIITNEDKIIFVEHSFKYDKETVIVVKLLFMSEHKNYMVCYYSELPEKCKIK